MKKWMVFLLLCAVFLSACSTAETFETISDTIDEPNIAPMHLLVFTLPQEAAAPTVESGDARLYQCESYTISIETLPAGDLNATVETLSGYQADALTLMQTKRDGYPCYEFAWASAGENDDQVGRALVLDDGAYHYTICVLGDAATAAQNRIRWEELFQSASLGEY